MGKCHYTNGGGVNYLCMPLDPEFQDSAQGGHQHGAYVYGVEYEGNGQSPFHPIHDHDAPCAVCEVQGRALVLMIPAKRTCPSGWTLEYDGWLASQHSAQGASDFVCVSSGMETTTSGQPDHNGGLLYVAEAVSGSLPDPPYTNGYELTCVVCTK